MAPAQGVALDGTPSICGSSDGRLGGEQQAGPSPWRDEGQRVLAYERKASVALWRVAVQRHHSLDVPREQDQPVRCTARTNIDIDDELCRRVIDRFHLTTKRDAVNPALRRLAGEPLGLGEARSLRGSGWDGDPDEMRASKS